MQMVFKQVCKAAIQKFDLGDHKDKLTADYSAGNRRKVQAAVSMLGEPQLVLMVRTDI